MHLPGAPGSTSFALIATALAADRFVFETFFLVELLFGNGKRKGLATISTGDGFVFHENFLGYSRQLIN